MASTKSRAYRPKPRLFGGQRPLGESQGLIRNCSYVMHVTFIERLFNNNNGL